MAKNLDTQGRKILEAREVMRIYQPVVNLINHKLDYKNDQWRDAKGGYIRPDIALDHLFGVVIRGIQECGCGLQIGDFLRQKYFVSVMILPKDFTLGSDPPVRFTSKEYPSIHHCAVAAHIFCKTGAVAPWDGKRFVIDHDSVWQDFNDFEFAEKEWEELWSNLSTGTSPAESSGYCSTTNPSTPPSDTPDPGPSTTGSTGCPSPSSTPSPS
jgi:hypothetical protein